MKLKNRFLISALAGVLAFSSSVGVFAQEFDSTNLAMTETENSQFNIEDITEEELIDVKTYSTDTVLEDILSSYHRQMQNITSDKSLVTLSAVESSRREIQEETVNMLNEVGYEAYDVNPETFDELQIVLSTDFNALGFDSSSSYIIVIEGEGNGDTAPYATEYSSNYSDTTWRKNQAAIGFNSSSIRYNTVGDVAYKYGSSTKITHRENF
ncbi:MAG: hypothetical protein RSA85_05445 [Cellulosilyticaceae bacterium]